VHVIYDVVGVCVYNNVGHLQVVLDDLAADANFHDDQVRINPAHRRSWDEGHGLEDRPTGGCGDETGRDHDPLQRDRCADRSSRKPSFRS
jgi:hypothetical protein